MHLTAIEPPRPPSTTSCFGLYAFLAGALSKIGAAVGTMYAGAAITAIGLVVCIAWAEETRGRSVHEASAAAVAERGPGTAENAQGAHVARSVTSGGRAR